jgi:hypothetical protein
MAAREELAESEVGSRDLQAIGVAASTIAATCYTDRVLPLRSACRASIPVPHLKFIK